MSEPHRTKLEDVVDYQTGYPFKSKDYSEIGIRLLRGDNIGQGFLRWQNAKRWPEAGIVGKVENYRLEQSDVVLAMDRPWIEAGLKCSVVGADDLPSLLVQRVARLRGTEKLDSGFLRYLISSKEFTEYIHDITTGTAVPHISGKDILAFEFDLPNIEVQREIAGVLGALDDKIEANRKAAACLEEMARALYRSWFVAFEPVHAKSQNRPPAHMPPTTAALFPDRFGENGLPEGWEPVSLSTVMDIKGGTQPPKSEFIYKSADGYVRLVQIRDYDGDSHLTFVKDTTKLRKCSAKDVMIGRYGASVGRVGWGLNGAYNVALVKAEPLDFRDREYVRLLCLSVEFQDYIQAICGRSAQSGFNKSDIAAFDVVAATADIRAAFSKAVMPLREKQGQIRSENQTLATLRDTLLPRLMSGTLRVKAAQTEIEKAL